MFLSTYGIHFPSSKPNLYSAFEVLVCRHSLSPNLKRISKVLGTILVAANDFESVHYASSN
jgi:hypothetical protein